MLHKPLRMKQLYILLFLLSSIIAHGQVEAYLESYRLSGSNDYLKEQEILAVSGSLHSQLLPYLNDTMPQIRQKAYSFMYRKGQSIEGDERKDYVTSLIDGCNDVDGGIVGQNLIWLRSFEKGDFSGQGKEKIEAFIRKPRMPHRRDLLMLAAYLGVGGELMKRQLLQDDLSFSEQRYLNLALARMGNQSSIVFFQGLLSRMPLNNEFVEYIVPDLVYTRQKELLDICVVYINSDEFLCSSADPDNERAMLCAYRILELIAPVIMDFPLKVSGLGTLITDDYQEALYICRDWFEKNPSYVINAEQF